jgi:hypothetical protein
LAKAAECGVITMTKKVGWKEGEGGPRQGESSTINANKSDELNFFDTVCKIKFQSLHFLSDSFLLAKRAKEKRS